MGIFFFPLCQSTRPLFLQDTPSTRSFPPLYAYIAPSCLSKSQKKEWEEKEEEEEEEEEEKKEKENEKEKEKKRQK